MTTCARFGRSVTRPSDARNVSTVAAEPKASDLVAPQRRCRAMDAAAVLVHRRVGDGRPGHAVPGKGVERAVGRSLRHQEPTGRGRQGVVDPGIVGRIDLYEADATRLQFL